MKGGVWYDPKTDTYNWIGAKLGRRMTEKASEFLSEVGPYLYSSPSKDRPSAPMTAAEDVPRAKPAREMPVERPELTYKIAQAELALQQAWDALRPPTREHLRPEQQEWVKEKDALSGEDKLDEIRLRTTYLVDYRESLKNISPGAKNVPRWEAYRERQEELRMENNNPDIFRQNERQKQNNRNGKEEKNNSGNS